MLIKNISCRIRFNNRLFCFKWMKNRQLAAYNLRNMINYVWHMLKGHFLLRDDIITTHTPLSVKHQLDGNRLETANIAKCFSRTFTLSNTKQRKTGWKLGYCKDTIETTDLEQPTSLAMAACYQCFFFFLGFLFFASEYLMEYALKRPFLLLLG